MLYLDIHISLLVLVSRPLIIKHKLFWGLHDYTQLKSQLSHQIQKYLNIISHDIHLDDFFLPKEICLGIFFSKQIILPLVIKKGHNGYIIQSIFSQTRLVQTMVKETNLCTQHRENNPAILIYSLDTLQGIVMVCP